MMSCDGSGEPWGEVRVTRRHGVEEDFAARAVGPVVEDEAERSRCLLLGLW